MQTESHIKTACYKLHIKGLVQGVGFRPFIYRVANELKLKGTVENRNDGVHVQLLGSLEKIKYFEEKVIQEAPQASNILSITIEEIAYVAFNDFKIVKSSSVSQEITQVSPDIAACEDCLNDLKFQAHRIAYPFTNCTNCGPRYSIIKSLPYDRPNTTMEAFEMCETCQTEYTTIEDRRFHAQPVACNHCGPVHTLHTEKQTITNITEIIDTLAIGISNGEVFTIKGIGGFFLLCDASNEKAVNKIREIKNRVGKPLAIMASTIEKANKIAKISDKEKELIESWQRPIVLLNYLGGLAKGVSNGLSTIGVMLPYMPFHYQLFEKLKTPFIVLTSGNLSDEPICIDNQKALEIFKNKTSGILTYNREIFNRVDDSVCKIVNNNTQIIRRSRSFSPQPIYTNLNTEGIFAAGAELVNSFCLGKGNQAIMSPYIGDLKNVETLEFYEETFHRFEKLFRFQPNLVAFDLHPNYLSSQFVQTLAENYDIKTLKIQHHHAHIASVMVSNNLDEDVIGISFDGTGLGSDGNIWGAEFFKANLSEFERLYHFENIAMPGGDRAAKEPWRMALAYLHDTFGIEKLPNNLPIYKAIEAQKISNILQIIEKKINTPLASSAGRLFDAVASIIGLNHFNTFQAEAPMRLESIIDTNEKGYYSYDIYGFEISFKKMIQSIVKDQLDGISQNTISAKFHNTIIEMVVEICKKLKNKTQINKVVLSGGTFQNSYLSSQIEKRLHELDFEVYLPKGVPANDQGIALGQLAIAAKKRSLGLI